ncbi:WD40 repeat domain-containing serine/threonine protein kinase [Sphaerisporangium perillae]|uniref:WD40 repeat domain-containing serine/threonine protein kinase n=1 Tax=Sphaerisporangium perillae TaxID=2935860 RepID=UPI00200F5DFF|nr:WD40 repeat domain-containing serine/threonine protein kinase [Sphaerisporangium perillae]
MALSPLTPSDPQRLGGYWLAGRLGAGGQGVVYEAYGEEGERVAVKVPRLDDPASRARLAKEAAAAQRVASFCTARVLEARTDVPEPFIVSEYVPGPNLRQVIGRTGPYEGDLLLRLTIGVATALTAIHQVGIVHRDLKPDNIILGPDGPRVIDFGVARQLGAPGTTTGPIMGTPNYMAPELFAGREASAAADIWAFGLTVLFAATGHDAVPERDPFAVVTKVLDFRPDVGVLADPLRSAVAGALAREAEARPSARALLLTLLGGMSGTGGTGGLFGSGDADGSDGDPLLADGGVVAAGVRPPDAARAAEPDLGTLAEELYQELSEGERAVAPEVFLRMVGASEDSEETIRHVPREELPGVPGDGPAASLLSVYGAAGLVVETDTAFTLAHPALIQAWPRLREWVAEDRDGLPVHRRLTEAARAWDRLGRKAGDLLHGSSLDRALRWAAAERRHVTLIPLEREYLEAAATLARRTSRRRGMLAAALAVLLVLALAGGGLAEYLRRVANRERDDASARSLAVRAADLRQSDPRLAMLMSVAAWRLAPALPQSLGALHDSLSQPMTDSFTDPDVTAGTVYACGPGGRTLVAVRAGQVTVWDVRAHRAARRFSGVSTTVVKAALRPDGKVLALQDDGGVRLWDLATGTAIGDRFAAGTAPGDLGELRFDPTGRSLAVPESHGRTGAAVWWDLTRHERIRAGSGAGVDAVNADGTLGVVHSTGAGRAELWDLKSGHRVPATWLPEKKNVRDVEFSQDGRALAVTESLPGLRGGVKLSLRQARAGTPLKADGAGPVGDDIAFGYDDRFVALWSARNLLVLRLADNQIVLQRELSVEIADLWFDETDRALRVLSSFGAVTTLDMAPLLDRPVLPGSYGGKALLGPGGRVLALYDGDAVRLWDVRAGRTIGRPVELENPSYSLPALAFGPDGRLAIGGFVHLGASGAAKTAKVSGVPTGPTGSVGSRGPVGTGSAEARAGVVIVDTSDGSVTTSFLVADREAQGVSGLAFSPDGATLAVAPDHLGPAGPLELWDLGRRQAVVVPEVAGSAHMAYRPDGRLLVAGVETELSLVDPDKRTRLPRPGGSGSLAAGPYAFSPDGRRVAIGAETTRLSVWDADFRAPTGQAFPEASAGAIVTAVWSPDGRTIATYGSGDRVRLWDVSSRLPLGLVFDGLTDEGFGWQASLAFGEDGRTLISATPDGVVRRHPLDGDRIASEVCARARGRPGPQEWRRYVSEVGYTDVCG